MYLKDIGYEGVHWIKLDKGKAKQRVLVNTIMIIWGNGKRRISRSAERLLASQETFCFKKLLIATNIEEIKIVSWKVVATMRQLNMLGYTALTYVLPS
jgi:hypothetical protein